MSNMSYCRFTNTRDDLEDCLSSLEYEETVSESEAIAGKKMFRRFLSFCRDADIIQSYDYEMVEHLFQNLQE
ncbi:MAG: hypothetical protein J5449_00260 [Oscillospiraceae bacterium]|nr:hypothetical protein [Oscillospiraceae bacterium]